MIMFDQIRSGLTAIRSRLSPPVFPGDEDKTRVADMLNIILLSALGLAGAFMLFAPLISPSPVFSLVTTGALLLPLILSLVLVRRGQVRAASILLSALLWLLITLSAVWAGGVHSSSFSTYVLVILITGLLLGTRAGLIIAGLSIVAGLGMVYAELQGFLPRPLISSSPVSIWFALTANFLAGVAVLYLAVRSLSNIVEQARRGAHSLAESNRELQVIRTSLEQHNRRLQATVRRYISYMAEVGQGRLSARLPLDEEGRGSDDPLIFLGRQLNETTESLHRMVSQTRGAAQGLSEAAADILAVNTQQAININEQSAAIVQTVNIVDEVKIIAEQGTRRAQEVATAAQHTVEVSQSGRHAVQNTFESMAKIKERAEGVAQNIVMLTEKIQEIGTIIATVNEIAAHSNIVALNASIEAARAGVHGAGFGVVAVEVRHLAEQSRQATAQVRTILSEIQNAASTTVEATADGIREIDRGVALTAEAQRAIEQLSRVIEESAQAALQMVAGGQQQTTGIEQIASAMQQINQAAMQSLQGMRQAEQAAQRLHALARRLNETVEQYRL